MDADKLTKTTLINNFDPKSQIYYDRNKLWLWYYQFYISINQLNPFRVENANTGIQFIMLI